MITLTKPVLGVLFYLFKNCNDKNHKKWAYDTFHIFFYTLNYTLSLKTVITADFLRKNLAQQAY